jgi:putative glutamine amidotransferase
MRPVLGITCCTRGIGTEQAQVVIDRYVVAAMRHADAAALLIPALPDLMRADEVASRLDGLLLTGSPSNIDPARYGDAKGARNAEGPFDRGRDAMTASLVAAMIALGRPVFGVCRGFQELNVALGGTLRRDTSHNPALLPHHAPDGTAFDAMFDHRHPVALTPGGILHTSFGADSLTVSSVHYQGLAALAPALSVEATAPDGIVEAVSATINHAAVLAVQWHPEWDADTNSESRAFFHLLARALRGQHPRQK